MPSAGRSYALRVDLGAVRHNAWDPGLPGGADFRSAARLARRNSGLSQYVTLAGSAGSVSAQIAHALNKKAAEGHGELFIAWRYHAVLTDSPFVMQVEDQRRDHAIVEQAYADSNEATRLPSVRQVPHQRRVAGHRRHRQNLVHAAGTLAGPVHAKARAATIRRGHISVAVQGSDGRRVPAGEHGLVTALSCVLCDQGAGVTSGAVEHPGLCPAHGCCAALVSGWYTQPVQRDSPPPKVASSRIPSSFCSGLW
jgi:hypothetical protein